MLCSLSLVSQRTFSDWNARSHLLWFLWRTWRSWRRWSQQRWPRRFPWVRWPRSCRDSYAACSTCNWSSWRQNWKRKNFSDLTRFLANHPDSLINQLSKPWKIFGALGVRGLFFIRYDNRITRMITKILQSQVLSTIILEANYQMFQILLWWFILTPKIDSYVFVLQLAVDGQQAELSTTQVGSSCAWVFSGLFPMPCKFCRFDGLSPVPTRYQRAGMCLGTTTTDKPRGNGPTTGLLRDPNLFNHWEVPHPEYFTEIPHKRIWKHRTMDLATFTKCASENAGHRETAVTPRLWLKLIFGDLLVVSNFPELWHLEGCSGDPDRGAHQQSVSSRVDSQIYLRENMTCLYLVCSFKDIRSRPKPLFCRLRADLPCSRDRCAHICSHWSLQWWE